MGWGGSLSLYEPLDCTLVGQEFDPWSLCVDSFLRSPPEGIYVRSLAPSGLMVPACKYRDRRRLARAGATRNVSGRGWRGQGADTGQALE